MALSNPQHINFINKLRHNTGNGVNALYESFALLDIFTTQNYADPTTGITQADLVDGNKDLTPTDIVNANTALLAIQALLTANSQQLTAIQAVLPTPSASGGVLKAYLQKLAR